MGQKGNAQLQRDGKIRTIEYHELEKDPQGSSPALSPAQDNLKNLTLQFFV